MTAHEQPANGKLTKHDGKQEGEGGNGEHSRVDLPVARHAIGIHNRLQNATASHSGEAADIDSTACKIRE
jgi:hypothetical protein